MTDREEREEHIKRLEAALACEEKQFLGKCSKQTCDDNCALLYEQGNWGEWKETLRYAINSLKIDLKYDLLYEETSGQADKSTTKNNLGVDYISRKAVQTRLKEIINEMETIFADIREREVNDSVCGLCEYDCDHGLDGYANECPGFEKDDCFKLNEKYKVEWLDISNLPSVTPQEPRWIPVSKLPKAGEYIGDVARYYLVQNEYGDMMVASYDGIGWQQMYQHGYVEDKVVAWMTLPQKYREVEK